ncbi:hypothetical protein MBIO_0234 [Mycoplasmopsis fermentans PG18]|uniref:Uncharacterized protein n=1 Tax=Mycoplasmopsis fermentans (strain ATCC 19989 / NBRC 14854 / NCTC 10117 / PG18) TaxID=496833 RepID=C4XEC7_MYCFP|nr:hypothetical protein [Mycoplasmopsis fermentans]BAH69499.1 hypothetical protein MBIO_0234 [Mycoplasmopsis fermentans PG18]VEU60226.1 Uncharacterised protein [Mycoplasmopsis fermentans]VEU67693.1 Uncharacterised protein [Mesomycoplasma conjunctivae]
MNRKLSLTLGTLATGVVAVGIGTAIYALVKTNKDNKSIERQLSSFTFSLAKPKDKLYQTNIANHLASEFTYSNYYYFETYNSNKEPTLKNTKEYEKNYWRTQLEGNIEKGWLKNDDLSPQGALRNQLFSLRNNRFDRIDKFYKDYNIFYHSYANDFTGTLYLTVSLEDKANEKDKDKKTRNISDRIKNWTSKTFVLNGFKKVTEKDVVETNTKLISNPKSWKMDIRDKIRQTFYKKEKSSLDELLAALPQKDLSSDLNKNKEEILKNNSTIESWFDIGRTLDKKSNNPEYKLDTKRGMWFTKASEKSLNLHFYAYKIVPEAEMPKDKNDKTSLIKSRMIDIKNPIVQEIDINYFELEKVLKNHVEISILGNYEIKNIDFKTPSTSLEWINNSTDEFGEYKNASKGYYKRIQLKFKDDFKNSHLYQLFYCTKQTEDYDKDKTKYKNEGLVSFDPAKGEATFAIGIRVKNSNNNYKSSSIPEYIGHITLGGFKKS